MNNIGLHLVSMTIFEILCVDLGTSHGHSSSNVVNTPMLYTYGMTYDCVV